MSAELEPADIFFTRGKGFISKAIRFFTRGIGEKRTKVNHVGIVVDGGPISRAVVIEALTKVKRHRLYAQYGGGKTEVAVYRPTNLSAEDKAQIVTKAESYVGRKYGFLKIATHLLDWCLFGAYFFRRLTQTDKYPICSWVVAHAYGAAGKDFGVDAGAASPDDIWDFVHGHTDKYEQVRELSPL
jgi:hypothetical protein